MTLLVDKTHFAALGIVLALNLDESELARYISQAQEFDIRPVLGDIFYYDLLENVADYDYEALIEGGIDYEYQGYSYKFQFGLAAAICFYAYARYIPYANKKSTEMGLMQKRNEFSDHVDTKALQLMVNDSKSAAVGYLNDVVLFLDRYRTVEPTKYTLWRRGGAPGLFGSDRSREPKPGQKITKVGNI